MKDHNIYFYYLLGRWCDLMVPHSINTRQLSEVAYKVVRPKETLGVGLQ